MQEKKEKMLANSIFCFFLNIFQQPGLITLYHTKTSPEAQRKKTFENMVIKGDNAGNQHYAAFPRMFLAYERQMSCSRYLICHLQMLSIWTRLKYGYYSLKMYYKGIKPSNKSYYVNICLTQKSTLIAR